MNERLQDLKALAFDIIRERDALQQQVQERSSQLAAVTQAITQLEAQLMAASTQVLPPPTEAQPE